MRARRLLRWALAAALGHGRAKTPIIRLGRSASDQRTLQLQDKRSKPKPPKSCHMSQQQIERDFIAAAGAAVS
jgi:hypothetical protein